MSDQSEDLRAGEADAAPPAAVRDPMSLLEVVPATQPKTYKRDDPPHARKLADMLTELVPAPRPRSLFPAQPTDGGQ